MGSGHPENLCLICRKVDWIFKKYGFTLGESVLTNWSNDEDFNNVWSLYMYTANIRQTYLTGGAIFLH